MLLGHFPADGLLEEVEYSSDELEEEETLDVSLDASELPDIEI